MAKRAFTLPELLLSLVLMSIVSTAIIRLTIQVVRSNRSESERVQIDANLRSALAFLRREFRSLDATDPAGSDLIEANESALVYRSMQGLYTVCGSTASPRMHLVLRRALDTGVPSLGGADSLFLFAEGDAATGRDAQWLRAGVVASSSSGICADGSGGHTVTLGGLPASEFHRIAPGSPVRNFAIKWLRLYRDGQGFWWLGERRWSAPNGWSRTQPIVGPFMSDGVRFTYLDRSGTPTTRTSAVARIGISLIGAPTRRTSVARDGAVRPSHIIESDVALRNNAR